MSDLDVNQDVKDLSQLIQNHLSYQIMLAFPKKMQYLENNMSFDKEYLKNFNDTKLSLQKLSSFQNCPENVKQLFNQFEILDTKFEKMLFD